MANLRAIPERADLVRPSFFLDWWDALFRYVDWTADDLIELRLIGNVVDADTGEITLYQNSRHYQPAVDETPVPEWMAVQARQAATIGAGVYMAPAVLNYRKAMDDTVTAHVCFTMDFDTGNPGENILMMAAAGFPEPTLMIKTGGVTPEGHDKLHAHWRLSEPCDEPAILARLREIAALRFGADTCFKRIPQVARIPGSIYDKTDEPKLVNIAKVSPNSEIDFEMLKEILEYDPNEQAKGLSKIEGMMDFSGQVGGSDTRRTPEESRARLSELETTTIHAGGVDQDTRWGRFTEYAGRQIAQARHGVITLKDAADYVVSWVETNMDPAWDIQRIESEFLGILARDRQNHPGDWEILEAPQEIIADEQDDSEWDIEKFSGIQRFHGVAPEVNWLVENFLIERSVHALVADGGVGKTYISLELALRCAIGQGDFMGFRVARPSRVVMLTMEDNTDDIHRRLGNLDPEGKLRRAAGQNFLVVPIIDEIKGGLTLLERDERGNFRPSVAWKFLLEKMGPRDLVIMDTYSATHHGDENSSVASNEWFAAARMVCQECGAALMVTHHTRKPSSDTPIKTTNEFRNSIRGSGAFINNCRAVFGVWEMDDAYKLVKASGLEPDARIFNLGLAKTNTVIDWSSVSPGHKDPILTLRRMGTGQLVFDQTVHQSRLSDVKNNARSAVMRSLEVCIQAYAEASWPLSPTIIKNEAEAYLEGAARHAGRRLLEDCRAELLYNKRIVEVSIKTGGRGGGRKAYDIPGGPFTIGVQQDVLSSNPFIDWTAYDMSGG